MSSAMSTVPPTSGPPSPSVADSDPSSPPPSSLDQQVAEAVEQLAPRTIVYAGLGLHAPRTIVYAGLGLPCDACGRPAIEFAHLKNGHVYGRHRMGTQEWLCQIQ